MNITEQSRIEETLKTPNSKEQYKTLERIQKDYNDTGSIKPLEYYFPFVVQSQIHNKELLYNNFLLCCISIVSRMTDKSFLRYFIYINTWHMQNMAQVCSPISSRKF